MFYAHAICKDPGKYFIKNHTYYFVVRQHWFNKISVTPVAYIQGEDQAETVMFNNLEIFVRTFEIQEVLTPEEHLKNEYEFQRNQQNPW